MLLSGLVAFVTAAVLTPLLAAWARRRNLLDIPNERSSHQVATPRIGGAAFVLALLTGLVVARSGGAGFSAVASLVVVASCGLAVVGLIDDFRSLPALLRLILQIGISILVAWAASTGALHPVAIAVIALWLTGATNAFNFMDGVDGIGACQAIAAGLGWAAIGLIIGSKDVAWLGLLAAAAPAGFLLFNWSPAKVFMGDGGSAFLGFFFAALPLATDRRPDLWICAALLIWPFLFDTGFTLARRIRRRENILNAHRSHLYQRLTATGLSHAKVSLLYALLAFTGLVSAVAVAAGQPRAFVLSAIVVSCSAAALWWYVVLRERGGPMKKEPSACGIRSRNP